MPHPSARFVPISAAPRNNGLSGLWSGSGLTSSLVAADSGKLGLAAVLGGSKVIVRPALIGDLNLDNQVSISDFIDLAANFDAAGVWASGDLNYDDITTISDFIDLASHFNEVYTPPPSAPAFAAASEAIVASPQAAASEEIVTSSEACDQTTSSSTTKIEKKLFAHGGH